MSKNLMVKSESRSSKIKKFKVLERNLSRQIREKCTNEIVLNNFDFHENTLSFAGYNRLKQECEYIDYSENIEIIVPKECANGFRETLESMVVNEASHIKKEMQEIYIMSVVFLCIGVFWFTLGSIFAIPAVLKEITIVATWVFVWTALDKWFFEGKALRHKKFNLYQMLLAKVTFTEQGNNGAQIKFT